MEQISSLIESEIASYFPSNSHFNITMSQYSHWKVGGQLRVLFRPSTVNELISIIGFLKSRELPYFVFGNTTNLLFCDGPINSIGIQLANNFSKVRVKDDLITAAAGIWVPCLARISMKNGLSGIEHIIGIPGSLGGLISMNGGSLRQQIGSNIQSVKTLSPEGLIKEYSNSDCKFSYRHSIFFDNDEIIIEATLTLIKRKSSSDIRRDMLSILKARREKFPRKIPNCGSVFQSTGEVYERYGPPGRIIESLGLKGIEYGGAQVSNEHANFIVNNGSAKASDILYLINLVREKVFVKTGHTLPVEPKFVSAEGIIKEI